MLKCRVDEVDVVESGMPSEKSILGLVDDEDEYQ